MALSQFPFCWASPIFRLAILKASKALLLSSFSVGKAAISESVILSSVLCAEAGQ
jgi:hypothetical protein